MDPQRQQAPSTMRGSVEAVSDGWDFYAGARAAEWVDLFDRGREEEIDALGFEEGAVGVEGAGIAGEVLVGAELSGIDEDGCGDDVALFFGGTDEREMALMEGSHGGDEAEGCIWADGCACLSAGVSHLLDCS